MAKSYACPKCGSRILAADLAAGQCGSCGARWRIKPATNAPVDPGVQVDAPPKRPTDRADPGVRADAPEGRGARRQPQAEPDDDLMAEEVDDAPRAERRKPSPEGWSTFRTALGLLFWGSVIYVVAVLINAAVGPGADKPQPLDGLRAAESTSAMKTLTTVIRGVGIVGSVLSWIGCLMFCGIPQRTGAWGLAVGGNFFIVAAVGVLIWFYVALYSVTASIPQADPTAGVSLPALAVIVLALIVAADLCLTLVLRTAARYWRADACGAAFLGVFLARWGATLVAVSMVVVMAFSNQRAGRFDVAAAASRGAVVQVFLIVYALGMLALLIWYLVLLSKLREIIRLRRT